MEGGIARGDQVSMAAVISWVADLVVKHFEGFGKIAGQGKMRSPQFAGEAVLVMSAQKS
jgi:hypothetical protein